MLYGPLWRALPGRRVAKLAQVLVLALVVVAVCFLWVFPAVAPFVPFNDNTVDGSVPSAPPPASSTPASSTPAPSTPAPSTPGPSTSGPSTPVPSTPSGSPT